MLATLAGALMVRPESAAPAKPRQLPSLLPIGYAALLVLVLLPVNARASHVSQAIIWTKPGDQSKDNIATQMQIFQNEIFNAPLGTGFTEAPRQLGASTLQHIRAGHFQDEGALQAQVVSTTVERLREVWQTYPYDLQTPLALAKVLAINGESIQDKGQMEQAVEILKQAQAYSPQRIEIMYDLGLYQMALGDTASSLATYKRMHELTPGVPFTAWTYGYALVRAGDLAQAKALMEGALADPDFHDYVYGQSYMLQRLVDLYVQEKDYQPLAATYRQLLVLSPDRGDIWGSLAMAYQQLGDFTNAIAAAQEAAKVNPEFASASAQLIDELTKQQQGKP
jgi:tetratricopeptide (TPR) repeat protein